MNVGAPTDNVLPNIAQTTWQPHLPSNPGDTFVKVGVIGVMSEFIVHGLQHENEETHS